MHSIDPETMKAFATLTLGSIGSVIVLLRLNVVRSQLVVPTFALPPLGEHYADYEKSRRTRFLTFLPAMRVFLRMVFVAAIIVAFRNRQTVSCSSGAPS